MQQLFCLVKMKFFLIFLISVFLFPFCSGAHYITGIANDAFDSRSANDLKVVLWNSANGISDNLTDVIGVNGNSRADNVYLIDCEMLKISCEVNDVLSVKVLSYPYSYEVNLTVTGAGFDVASNITLNSIPSFSFVFVDDSFQFPVFPENEIDLFANATREVFCEAVIEELDGDTLQNITGKFFDNSVSFFQDSDDNNYHYTNQSCFLNSSYGGENETQVICGFQVLYNANYGNWNCTIKVEDNLSAINLGSDFTNVNQLLSIGINDSVDFGTFGGGIVTDEVEIGITNFGNTIVNLSLSGYGVSEGDGYSMVCSNGEIPIFYKKYNLTDSTFGVLSLSEFEQRYVNLTSSLVNKEFNLNPRQNEVFNEAVNSTYWRTYVPFGVSGSCSGNIVVGAVAS